MPPRSTAFVLFAGFLALAGCDTYDTPKRYVDTTVQPPIVDAVNFTDLPSGQVMTGTVPLRIDLDSLNQSAVTVTLYVDTPDRGYSIGLPPPGIVPLDTWEYAEGPHTLVLEVQDGDTNLGLFGGSGVPTHVFTVDVVFEQIPLEEPVVNATWNDAGVTLSWDTTEHPFFTEYRVLRQAGWDDLEGPAVIATIADREQTTYVDAEAPSIFGAGAAYYVETVTWTEGTAQSDYTPVQYSSGVFAGNLVYGGQAFLSRLRTLFLVKTHDGLLQAVSNDGGSPLWITDAEIRDPELALVRSSLPAGLTEDGTDLIYRVEALENEDDTADQQFIYRKDVDRRTEPDTRIPTDLAVVDVMPARTGRFAVVDDTGALHLLDASGTSLSHLDDIAQYRVHVTRDRRTALVAQYDDATTATTACTLTSVDLSTDTLQPLTTVTIPDAHPLCLEEVTMGESTALFIRDRYTAPVLELRDARTLSVRATQPVQNYATLTDDARVPAVSFVNGTVLLSVNRGVPSPRVGNGLVLRLNPETLSEAERWQFMNPPYQILSPIGTNHAFAYADLLDDATAWKLPFSW